MENVIIAPLPDPPCNSTPEKDPFVYPIPFWVIAPTYCSTVTSAVALLPVPPVKETAM